MHKYPAFMNLKQEKIYIRPYQRAQHQLTFSWASSVSVSQLVLLVHFGYHSLYLALKEKQTYKYFLTNYILANN